MPKSERVTVRPADQTSILDKRFERLVTHEKEVKHNSTHAVVVLNDLKRGSLKSLAKYLRETGGITDPEIALALHKLIDGNTSHTCFRVIVVDHPDQPLNRGGRPKSKKISLTEREEALIARFDAALKVEKKHQLAVAAASKAAGVSQPTISRALQKRRRLDRQLAEREEAKNRIIERGEEARANLRKQGGT